MQTVEVSEDRESQPQPEHKLLRLTSEYIRKYWPKIRESIVLALPPSMQLGEEEMGNVLQALVSGRADCWMLTKGTKIIGIMTTTLSVDEISGTVNLLIYSLAGYHYIGDSVWKDSFSKLKRFAKGKGCAKVIAFSSEKRILGIVEKLGGSTSVHFVELEV